MPDSPPRDFTCGAGNALRIEMVRGVVKIKATEPDEDAEVSTLWDARDARKIARAILLAADAADEHAGRGRSAH